MARGDGYVLPDIPSSLEAALAGAAWLPVAVGMSGARVWRVEAEDCALRYLKHAQGPYARELGEERARLEWLQGWLPVPAVEGWAENEDGGAWLLLSAVPGVMAHEAAPDLGDMAAVVRAVAEGLRRIHSLPIADCPFDYTRDVRLARAAWNIEQNIVDVADVRANHHIEPLALLARLEATRPPEPPEDQVFVHGDYCLPNILMTPDAAGVPRVSGLLDWARAGISDRYQDLAIGARTLRHNFGPGWEPLFFTAYGLSAPDPARVAWYEALDELF